MQSDANSKMHYGLVAKQYLCSLLALIRFMFAVYLPFLLTFNKVASILQWANLPSMMCVCCANVCQPGALNILASIQHLGKHSETFLQQ